MRRQNFVPDLDKDGCAQTLELHFASESDPRPISTPGSRFPIIYPIVETSLAVLEDRREFSALMMPRNGVAAIEDRDSVSALGITGRL
ncbi:MAG TPA: hypothetical protein VI386_19280 [Candidatus Sulfotelmatobacter sp.]